MSPLYEKLYKTGGCEVILLFCTPKLKKSKAYTVLIQLKGLHVNRILHAVVKDNKFVDAK